MKKTQLDTRPVSAEELMALNPFDELTEDERIIAASHAQHEHVPPGTCLAAAGATDDWSLYLLQGKLRLEAPDGRRIVVEAGTPGARFPVSNLRPHLYTITAISPVECIRLERGLLDGLVTGAKWSNYVIAGIENVHELWDTALFRRISHDLACDKLKLPTLPDLAIRIQRLVSDPECDSTAIAKLVQTDPGIAAKLIKAANSSFYMRQRAAESCAEAVVRLGMTTTRNLVISFLLRDVFTAQNSLLQRRAVELWRHSTQVAAISFVLARMTTGLDPERALLAGLLHDIGLVSVLSYLEDYPELASDAATLEATLTAFRAETGAMILGEWRFPDEMVVVCREAEEWYRDRAAEPDYCDLVLLAQLHSFVGTPRLASTPPIYELPAFNKLGLVGLTPERSLEVLRAANQEIAEARRLFVA